MKNKLLIPAVAVTVAFAAFACGGDNKSTDAVPGPDYLASHVDTTINPAQDFFACCNGAWIKSNPIPADEVSWGIAHLVDNQIYDIKKKINTDAASANAEAGSDTKKIGDFWATGMDSAKADKLGYSPLDAQLKKINAAASLNDVISVMTELEPLGV